MTFEQRFRDAIVNPSDIYEHLMGFVELAINLDATRVIELGTRRGTSTVAWLYAMEKTGGHLWSVDLDPAPALQHPQWTFIRGDDVHPTTLEQLPELVDVVFIDTSHAFEHTLMELEVYGRQVRPGGRILLHDTEIEHPEYTPEDDPPYPVKAAINAYCARRELTWTNAPHCCGLGTIEIPW